MKERFPARDHHMVGIEEISFGDDIIERKGFAFWVPRSLGGIAENAAQVTARSANKRRRNAIENAFALDRIKNFRYFHNPTLS